MKRRLTKGTGRCLTNASRGNARARWPSARRCRDVRDKAKIGSGKGEFLSQRQGGMVMEEEVEERRGWGWRLVLDGTSPSSRVFCVRERERSRRGE
jgi:hypothetical protein